MVGITSYGAYVPMLRLSREAIAKGARGEKAICNFDEDSITMAAAAANDCLNGIDRGMVDGLYFATTTSPYKEKLGATIVAMAADLRQDIITADFANSLRAGTSALISALDAIKAGSAKKVMVAAADCRLGTPGSTFEQNFGDGAGALLIGDKDVAVTVEGSYSVYSEILDIWRADGDTFVRSWEDRFASTHGYLETVGKAVSGLMQKYKLSPSDFAKVVLYSPDARRYVELARRLGFDDKTQVQEPLFAVMGNTGAAFPLMLLIAALEEAKAGDRILLASYGNGSDAFVLQVTEQIEKIKDRRGMKKHLASKKAIADYKKYLIWRGLLPQEEREPGPIRFLSAPAAWREREANFRLRGVKCQVCGTIQFPPQRVCTKCHTKDQFEPYRLSDKKAKIVSFAMDYVTPAPDLPTATTTIDFDGGGRMQCYMTDGEPEQVKCGLPVEMSFRKIIDKDGARIYFWKSIPVRT
ncbi:MAG: hydroxymethylglutaryl-CoA synthase [Dehalococcoidia bacterium]|nr:hydroxymethylglutaryl-CoA synthase [Dehalococcoidia bacterium]